MRPTLLLTAFFVALTLSAGAQNKKLPLNENKYRIDLPDYWGHRNKVWQILTEKLPLVCDELKNKQICGDNCRPKYTVGFYITEPEVVGYTRYKKPQPISTNTRALVNKMPGVSLNTPPYNRNFPIEYYNAAPNNVSNEKWETAGEYIFQCFLLLKDDTGHIITKFILVDTNEVWSSPYKAGSRSFFPSGDPDIFFEKNKELFTPDKFELMAIADKKLLAL